MASRPMLTAVNRQIKRLPEHLHNSAEAVLARELARDFDQGYRTTSPRLLKVLEQLRKLGAPPKAVSATADSTPEETEPDDLDRIRRARADRLAETAGVVSTIGSDKRRAGGRRAR